MATITGTNLLDQILADRGITGLSALQKSLLAARFDQMIEAGQFTNTQVALVLGNNPTIAATVPEGESLLTNLSQSVADAKDVIEALPTDPTDPTEPTEPTEPVLDTYELAAAKLDVNEGEANTFTVTAIGTDGQPFAVTADTTVTLKVIPGSTTAADQGTETTNLNDFGAGAFNLVTKTIAAGQSSVSFDVTALADSFTELTETYQVEVKLGELVFTKTINVLDGAIGAGETYMLTKGLDNFQGSAGNDTIIGSISADAELNTLSTLDIVNGGAGIDTLKISSSLAAIVLPKLTDV